VVNDGSPDKTYEYAANGDPGESWNLGGGNTAPRGAAASADGQYLWVVDSNKTVYTYLPTGAGYGGGWSAGGMTGNGQIEGLASNGTDIWLLDNSKDKVYKFANSATTTAGSINAASSFSLNGSNSNGKGIVTDGSYFWVVDDGPSTDKVFKYTLSGSLLGSWAIDPANTHPTGITINPSNVSDLWVVDSGTKKVYPYTAAASRTSGSQNAAASFALAANNTNPQDIADPPVPGLLLTPPTPLAPSQPPLAVFNTMSSVGVPAGAGGPSLAPRDAVFALLVRESLPGGSAVDLLTGRTRTPRLASPVPAADRAWRPSGPAGEQKSADRLTAATPGSSSGVLSEESAGSLLDRASADGEGSASRTGMDSFFARLAEDAPPEE
jgi:hypothetical protein